MRHDSQSSGMQIDVFAFDFGDIKLMKKTLSRFYYCYAEQGGFLYLRHTGTSDYDELIYYNAQIARDESWANGAKVFTDVRWLNSRAHSFETHYQLARDIAALYEKNGRHVSDVVALCSNNFEFGMFRMFYSVWEDDEPVTNTFLDLNAAVDFLKIDKELLERVISEVDKIEASAR